MVDINLIGDDQSQFEGEDSEKEYQQSYESELNEPTPSNYMSGGHLDDSDYTRMISRGGSKKLIYILAACSIILLAVAAWLLFQPGKGKKKISEPPIAAMSDTGTPAFEDTSKSYPGSETDITPIASLSPALREKITKSQRGISTVSSILNQIPDNVNFTMISYSDGKFLLEFLAATDAAINNVSNQLQQNLYSADVKLLSKENRTIKSRQLRQALINGGVDISQNTGASSNLQEPIYLNSTDLKNQLSNISRQTGLIVKQFDVKNEKAEGEFRILPIQFKATGQKNNILTFLQQINSSNINISFSKISLIANDVDLSDPNITLLLNIGLYRIS